MSHAELVITHADLTVPSHANAVLFLLDHYARGTMGGGKALAADVQQQLIPALQRETGCVILLAWVGEDVVGLAIAFLGFSTFNARPLLNLHDLAVHEDARGKGVGKALLGALEDEARRLGCCKLTLEVRNDNEVALGLYQKVGFGPSDPTASQMHFWAKPLTANNIDRGAAS